MGKGGVKISELNEKARKLAGQLLQKRLEVFSADRRKVIDDLISAGRRRRWPSPGGVGQHYQAAKGWRQLSLAHRRRYGDLRLQFAGKNHIHMTLRGRVKG